jgi:hypothetical protein
MISTKYHSRSLTNIRAYLCLFSDEGQFGHSICAQCQLGQPNYDIRAEKNTPEQFLIRRCSYLNGKLAYSVSQPLRCMLIAISPQAPNNAKNNRLSLIHTDAVDGSAEPQHWYSNLNQNVANKVCQRT